MALDRPICISQIYSRGKSACLLMERFPVEAKECALLPASGALRMAEDAVTRACSDHSFAFKTPLSLSYCCCILSTMHRMLSD